VEEEGALVLVFGVAVVAGWTLLSAEQVARASQKPKTQRR
jgi:hypothetical protein